MISVEETLYETDVKFLSCKRLRNDLEAYSYELRGKLEEEGSFVPYCEPEIRTKFLIDITETIEWLYEAGESAPLTEYEERLGRFREVGEAIRRRCRFYETLPEQKAELERVEEDPD